ncbi:aminoacyl-tRNA hydrolase [Patescibacteria group bacterium]|nr:aminoacyl-tRNA hydrolase [Patescibacteria group bacterium]
MLYIIGLGNPGEKYALTRHNVAWVVLDTLFPSGWNYHKYMNAEVKTGHAGLYIKPQTFMNNSGEVISFLKKEVDFEPEHVVLIYDDIDLPFGTIRISYDRGDGGHNGIKSVVDHLGSRKCIRVRIGVSTLLPNGDLSKPNVLGRIPPDELIDVYERIAPQVERVIESLVVDGLETTMNRYNTAM